MNAKRIVGFGLLAAVTVVVVALALTSRPPQTSRMTVAASFYPLYEFAKNVGGDKVAATNVTPAGAEPHDFEPSPQTLASLQDAKVLIYNGGTFEPWIDAFLRDYKHRAVKASEGIPLAEGHEGRDPHYWLDPVLAAQAVNTIRDSLMAAAPEHADYFRQNAAAYTTQLMQLDADFKGGLQNCGNRTIVTSHEAFTYLAKRYGLELIPIAGISPEEEPSPAKLAEISTLVRSKGIQYVFFESLASPRLADTIAQETGAKTATLDPIEGLNDEDQQKGKDYLAIQRENLSALRTALGCQ